MTHFPTERVEVEGRVRFRRREDAQRIADALLYSATGTVFDSPVAHSIERNSVSVAGRSLYLSWSGQAGGNDHEHTYMWLTQAIDGAEHGAFLVSGDVGDNVFCMPEEFENDHLTILMSSVWGLPGQIEFLRDGLTEHDLTELLLLWPELDTWEAKNSAMMLLCDFVDKRGVPAELAGIFRTLWATAEPTEFSPEAFNPEQELYDFWWVQAWTLMRTLPGKDMDVVGELTDRLDGELRRQKFLSYLPRAYTRLNQTL